MDGLGGWLLILAVVVVTAVYRNWLRNGIKPRGFETSASVEQLRRLFDDNVACFGWKIVDDGNPLVAQSNLATGIRQKIGLKVQNDETSGRVTVRLAALRSSRNIWGTPRKGHTLRIRMNNYVAAVRAIDPGLVVTLGKLGYWD